MIIPYVLFYIIVLLLSLKIKKSKYTVFDVALLAILILFSGLRYGIGTDYQLYRPIYDHSTGAIVATDRTGFGFSRMMAFSNGALGLDYAAFIFIVSAITNILIYHVIKRESKNPGNSIILYISLGFYCFAFNGFRQALSMSLVFWATSMLKENKKRRTFFAILAYIAAFMIHSSSIIGILFGIIFCKIRKKTVSPAIFVIIGIAMIVLYGSLFSLVGNIESYSVYVKTASDYAGGFGTLINSALYIMLFIVISGGERVESFNKNMASLGTTILVLGIFNWLFVRLSYFLTFYYVFAIDNMLHTWRKGKSRKIVNIAYYASMFSYFILNVVSFNGIVPYQTVLGGAL